MSAADKQALFQKLAGLCLAFSGLCFLTSFIFNLGIGAGEEIRQSLPSEGGDVGPISISKKYAVYNIEVRKNIRRDGEWSFVSGDVLDSNKEYLFGFGSELWKESGYDSDGAWYEEKTDYDLKVTFPKPGNYFLRFKTESNSRDHGGVLITLSPKIGSSLAHFILGVISLIMVVILTVVSSQQQENRFA